MDKSAIIRRIEHFAPLESAESWDCSGFIVNNANSEIKKIMLALTVTKDVFEQAITQNCDMIISHHPLFWVPLDFKNLNIYCAHTNLDKAQGGTTDVLIHTVFPHPKQEKVKFLNELSEPSTLDIEYSKLTKNDDEFSFLRFVEYENHINISDFLEKLKIISPNLRYVNNQKVKTIKKIAFCAGSGSEFISDAGLSGADAFVTGDLKFHTALDSDIVIFDIGHFESEILVLNVFEKLLDNEIETIYAKERSPFFSYGKHSK